MKDTYTNGAYSVPISQASMKVPEDVALKTTLKTPTDFSLFFPL